MSDIAVRVENLSKQYEIGVVKKRSDTLRDAITRFGSRISHLALRSTNSQSKFQNSKTETIWALKDVSLEVKRGEVIGIIGRNGAGKSTLLKILSRITEPTEGRAEIFGRVGSLLEVGTGFHPELTGRENIYLNGAILGMRKAEIERKLDEIVAFAEIEKFINTPVKRYSSGMYVRLAFAVAAHLEPEILLVDEVLAVGDATFQKKCLGKMGDVAKEGRTVLFVSHNMVTMQRLCKRIILFNEGKIVMDGVAERVIPAYLQFGDQIPAERVWDDIPKAPGDFTARLRRIRVRDANGETVERIDVRKPVGIEVEYYLLNAKAKPHVGLQFRNDQGIILFSSFDSPTSDRHPQHEQISIVRSTCWIPANFLNDDRIIVLVALTSFSPTPLDHIVLQEALAFEVIDSSLGGDTSRGDYPLKLQGIVRPMLDWKTEFQSMHEV